ncbi:MAG: tetratricopeptide repeat protein [Candidatus Eiseniibacteriota bacterium]
MSTTQKNHLHRTLLLAGVSALALAVGACSGAVKEQAEKEAKSDTGSAAALVRIGDASRAGGDLGTAVSFYQRASAVTPNDPATQLRLATALLEMGSYGEAEVAFQHVLAADAGNVEAMRGLGNIYIATDQPKRAVEQFENVIAKKPSYQAYNGLGVAFDLQGQHAAAQKAYHEGLAENASSLTLQNNLGLSLALSGNYPAAVELLQRVAQSPQATYRHRQNLALVYGLAGDTTHAAEVAKMDLDAKAVESNLAYYAWLRAQPKLSPSDVMRYSGPKGHPKTPAFEEGALPQKKAEIDIDATASAEPVDGVAPVNGPGAHVATVVPTTPLVASAPRQPAPARVAAAAPAKVETDRIFAAPRTPVIEEPVAAGQNVADDVDDADATDATDTARNVADGGYVLLPEERAAHTAKVVEVAHAAPRPAKRPTLHFRDMTFAQFASSVGVYGPACEDDYHAAKRENAHGPAEAPVVDKSKPVVASVGTAMTQTAEAVEPVAYQVDSQITLEGLRRY